MSDLTRDEHYRALGLAPGASRGEIQAAFRPLAHKYHPDHNPDDPIAAQAFKLLKEAYDALAAPAPASKSPVEAPARSTTESSLRLDGIYRTAPKHGTVNNIRLYADGQCADVSTVPSAAAAIARWFGVSDLGVSKGRYTVVGGVFQAYAESAQGRVEYQGPIEDDGLALRLTSHSYINGHRSTDTWHWEPVTFGAM